MKELSYLLLLPMILCRKFCRVFATFPSYSISGEKLDGDVPVAFGESFLLGTATHLPIAHQ